MSPKKSSRSKSQAESSKVFLNKEERISLYTQSNQLPKSLREKLNYLEHPTSFDDPFLLDPVSEGRSIDTIRAPWEPNLADGPTSSRFAVVDYDNDAETIEPPAQWQDDRRQFQAQSDLQKDQVSIWALLGRALEMFQHGNALGRVIPWAFEGSRLILVPHAGYDQNAYYDRQSKSLQFYYYENAQGQIEYTCRSIHIVAHEFGHALLDGIRPRLYASPSVESNAFHEFFGDLSALIVCLQDKELRQQSAKASEGEFQNATDFQQLAQRFGQALAGRPYLRSFKNQQTMKSLGGTTSHHDLSEVLSGAIFDILIGMGKKWNGNKTTKSRTPRQVFWNATNTLSRLTLQSLDLLPPVDISFRDYAFAICRWHQQCDPADNNQWISVISQAFRDRGIFDLLDVQSLKHSDRFILENRYGEEGPEASHDAIERARNFERLMYRPRRLTIRRRIEQLIGSPESAYRLLDDNRQELLIPLNCDFTVIDLYETDKLDESNRPLGKQFVLQYLWSEDVELLGERFGQYQSMQTAMLCGGTLVFDHSGNILSWSAKPGSRPYSDWPLGNKRKANHSPSIENSPSIEGPPSIESKRSIDRLWQAAIESGQVRREKFLEDLAIQISQGEIGSIVGTDFGILGRGIPPLIALSMPDGSIRFERTPHGHFADQNLGNLDHDTDSLGERSWNLSY